MKIEGNHEIHAPREVVYSALIDPQILRRCIPGCESLDKTADNTYLATMKVGIGPVKGTFKGNVRLEDMRPPEHYRLIVDGKGGPGFAVDDRSEEHTSELQSHSDLVCRLLLEKKKKK